MLLWIYMNTLYHLEFNLLLVGRERGAKAKKEEEKISLEKSFDAVFFFTFHFLFLSPSFSYLRLLSQENKVLFTSPHRGSFCK